MEANSAMLGSPGNPMAGQGPIQGILQMHMQPALAFKLALAQKQLVIHVESVNDTRKKLVAENEVEIEIPWEKDYKPKKDEKKKTKKEVPQEKIPELNKEFADFLKTEVDIDIQKINQGDFQNFGLKSIAPDQLMALEFMINLKK
jgi:hypothetical protein